MSRNDNLDRRGRERVQTSFAGQESQTVQSDGYKTDIKFILNQYAQSGMVAHLNKVEGEFRDISEFTDFADAMRHAKMAEVEFMTLPSKVREIFNHNVEEWLDTAHDKDKRDALVEAGIIARVETPVTKVVEEVVSGGGEPGGQEPPGAAGAE